MLTICIQKFASTKSLYCWKNYQRLLNRNGKLDDDKYARLSALGLPWNSYAITDIGYAEDEVSESEQHDAPVPTIASGNSKNDEVSESEQHDAPTHSVASVHSWELRWNEKFEALREFKGRHGHMNVRWVRSAETVSCNLMHDTDICYFQIDNKPLYNWLFRQRKKLADGKLDQDKIELLDSLSFESIADGKLDQDKIEGFGSLGFEPIKQTSRKRKHIREKGKYGEEETRTKDFRPPRAHFQTPSSPTGRGILTYTTVNTTDLHDIMDGLTNGSMTPIEAVDKMKKMTRIQLGITSTIQRERKICIRALYTIY